MGTTNIFLWLITLILFAIAVRFCWYPIMLSTFRDKLFKVRFELRDYFKENNLDMSSPAYKHTYDYINNSIRYVENASFLSFVLQANFLMRNKKYVEEHSRQIEEQLASLGDKDKTFIKAKRNEVANVFLFQLIRTSFIGIIFVLCIVLISLLKALLVFKSDSGYKKYVDTDNLDLIVTSPVH